MDIGSSGARASGPVFQIRAPSPESPVESTTAREVLKGRSNKREELLKFFLGRSSVGVKTVNDEERMQAGLRAIEKTKLPHMLCVTNMLLHNVQDPSFVRHDNALARPYISYTAADRVDVVLTNPPFGGKKRTESRRTSRRSSRPANG
jgi:hypothetical protein